MMSLIDFRLNLGIALLALVTGAVTFAQEKPPTVSFYDVQITKDEIYSYTNLKFNGDFTSFSSPSGQLALGRTEAGVTLVIILGDGTVTIDAPEAHQEKFKTVFGSCPLKANFKSVYMRLNPKEYDEAFGKLELAKSSDEAAFTKAKEFFDQVFLGSYHAGPKAILPPYKTRRMEFETVEFGQVHDDEGYWLKLRRVMPFASIYPANYVNPKQR